MFDDYVWSPRSRGDGWTTVAVPRGTSLFGVICGRIRIVLTHYNGECSKPCRREITKGAVHCYCQDGKPVGKRVYGYLPLRTRKDEKIVVILCASVAHVVKHWSVGQPVEVIAPEGEKVKTRCRQCPVHELGQRLVETVQARPAECIAEYLVYVLWHDDEVCEHFNGLAKKEDKKVYPPLVKRNKKATTKPQSKDNQSLPPELLSGIGLDPNAKV